jgi:aspartate carbamoyltransferase catalytic subunit
MPAELVDLAAGRGHRVEQTDRIESALPGAEAIYATRIQKERFAAGSAPLSYSRDFQIGRTSVDLYGSAETIIMHPLPRDSAAGANDLSTDLDSDDRLAIFRQTDAGIPTRMALFASVLGVADRVRDSLRDAQWYRPEYIGPRDASFYRTREP